MKGNNSQLHQKQLRNAVCVAQGGEPLSTGITGTQVPEDMKAGKQDQQSPTAAAGTWDQHDVRADTPDRPMRTGAPD